MNFVAGPAQFVAGRVAGDERRAYLSHRRRDDPSNDKKNVEGCVTEIRAFRVWRERNRERTTMIISTIAAALLVAAPADEAMELAAELPVENISENSQGFFQQVARRELQCGKKGERAERLAAMYDAITDAASEGDGDAVIEAAGRLDAYTQKSDLADECWDTLRKRVGISRSEDKLIGKIADLG